MMYVLPDYLCYCNYYSKFSQLVQKIGKFQFVVVLDRYFVHILTDVI